MNIPATIQEKLQCKLHTQENHPLCIIKHIIYNHFGSDFTTVDHLSPVVSLEDNFDKLLIPADHPARKPSDTYYVDPTHVLRTHTSAHQNNLIHTGLRKFLVTGDVYRKDTIDATHYPIFHQMEGVFITDEDIDIEQHLKQTLAGLIQTLFPDCEWRINSDYFPFTEPSFEVEVLYEGKWLEVLGCGIVHKQIMENNGLSHAKGWAFGLGLERLAMILFKIPDIRLFWTDDDRFISQFKAGVTKMEYKPYSVYPPSYKDIAFWVSDLFHENDFMEMIRENGKDWIEAVSLIDSFNNKGRESRCYHIVYRSNERTLTNEEVNHIQNKIREDVVQQFKVEIR